MKKFYKKTVGSILEIPVEYNEEKYYCYAQILEEGEVFFDYRSSTPLKDFSLLETAPILFFIAVYNDIITQGHWLKVGKMPIREDTKVVPLNFVHCALEPEKFNLYDPNIGEMYPATKEECRGLERCVVYASSSVEERLLDHFRNMPCIRLIEDYDLWGYEAYGFTESQRIPPMGTKEIHKYIKKHYDKSNWGF